MTTENSTSVGGYPEFNGYTFDELRLMLDTIGERAMDGVEMIDRFVTGATPEVRNVLMYLREHFRHIGFDADRTANDTGADLTQVWA